MYGDELADTYDRYYKESIREDWFPDYSGAGWRMAIFAGENAANWRAGSKQWRKEGFDKLEMIVVLAPDMGVTAHNADYILPIAHHYERADLMLQARIPYIQVLDIAVPPLGESVRRLGGQSPPGRGHMPAARRRGGCLPCVTRWMAGRCAGTTRAPTTTTRWTAASGA